MIEACAAPVEGRAEASAIRTHFSLEVRSELEIELAMTVIARGPSEHDRSHEGVPDDATVEIPREAGRQVKSRRQRIERPVGLAHLEHAKDVNVAAYKRRELFQAVQISGLKEKVLVGEQFVDPIRGELGRATQRKQREGSGLKIAISESSPA